jgi:hypothetical protein
MSADNKENEDNILFPINQGEQAKQATRNSLLARDVFKKIADLLKISVGKLKDKDCVELDDHRAHEAILIDGGRGTGKSSVLVNLQLYMDDEPVLKNQLLILQPVDPTLLENGDDLFLNIIVAALIRNIDIKKALNKGDKKAEAFYEQLQKLGSALEGVQTQKTQYGLDKLRAFIGNHGIAEEVHALFHNALQLTEKKLIVLPIDDVDTSLQHAFENMEVVRKYLATPYVVPIISGDLDLYHDVTWRDFFGRIIKDGRIDESDAKDRAQNLANEYQRKVLPYPRRINVPDIHSYLNSINIFLSDASDNALMPIANINFWLHSLLNERVNGIDNSVLTIPINSLREFSQLIFDLKGQIPELAKVDIGKDSLVRSIISICKPNQSEERENSPSLTNEILGKWHEILQKHFAYHERGGSVYLTMSTNLFWQKEILNDQTKSVFDTDLFQPFKHAKKEYQHFISTDDIQNNWKQHLSNLPDQALLNGIPTKSILPYPLPELGRSWYSPSLRSEILEVRGNIEDPIIDNDLRNSWAQLEFVRQLMSCDSSYKKSNRVNTVFSGRIFELIILSLVKNVDILDIKNILILAPFYSSESIINTKTSINFYATQPSQKDLLDPIDLIAEKLAKDLNQWRNDYGLQTSKTPNSWFIFNVMTKYFNQINEENSWILTTEGSSTQYNVKSAPMLYIFDVALRSFRSIWSIFGGYEKSPIFGLDQKISTNSGSVSDVVFEQNQLYLQNILPFLSKDSDALNFAYTRKLEAHPLKKLLETTFNFMSSQYQHARAEINQPEFSSSKSEPFIYSKMKRLNQSAGKFLSAWYGSIPTYREIPLAVENLYNPGIDMLVDFEKENKIEISNIQKISTSTTREFSTLNKLIDINKLIRRKISTGK